MIRLNGFKFVILFLLCNFVSAGQLKLSFNFTGGNIFKANVKRKGSFAPASNIKNEEKTFNYLLFPAVSNLGIDYFTPVSEKISLGGGFNIGYVFNYSDRAAEEGKSEKNAWLLLNSGFRVGVGPRLSIQATERFICSLICDFTVYNMRASHSLDLYPVISVDFWQYMVVPKIRVDISDANGLTGGFFSVGYSININDSESKKDYSSEFVSDKGKIVKTLSTDIDMTVSNAFLLEVGFFIKSK